jgi:hypothetical protein
LADSIFVARNGLQVNGDLVYANNNKVGIKNTAPDATLTVGGNGKFHSNLEVNGQVIITSGGIKFSDNTTLNTAPSGVTMSGTATWDVYQASNATSSAPSFSYHSDPNTGLYRAGEGTQSFTSNGTVSLTINSTSTVIPTTAYFGVGTVTVVNATTVAVGANVSMNLTHMKVGSVTISQTAISTSANATFNIVTASSFANLTVTGTVNNQANIAHQTLTDAATVTWDVSAGQIATVTLGGNRIMGAPTNLKVGTYILHIIQDGTGSRTITSWNAVFKWPSGVAPDLSSTAGARDIFSFICDGTNLYGSFLPNVS